MSKIRELGHEEATRLRQQVRQRFLRGRSNGNGFRPSSFKGAYENLRDDIVGKVLGSESSVSLTRLRKLFYYTDPAVCPPEQLEKTSFGRDFVEALEIYVREEASMPLVPVLALKDRKSTWKIGWFLFLLLPLGGIATWFFQPKPPKSWKEDFANTNPDNLRKRGFEWLDFDSSWWSKQVREGALTLYTHRGDYWVKPREQKEIRNMMYKRVRGDCFTIFAKVDDFDPQQNCQQLTIFLFDEHLSKETHLRAGISFWSPSKENPGLQHTTTEYQEYGQVTQQGYYHFREPANEGPPVKTFWLKIVYKNNQVEVFQKINNDWNIWGVCARPFDLRFKPAYIGIAAFQGWTDDDGTPRDAEPISVFVDYLQVESCDE
jgi:hypothetical protein